MQSIYLYSIENYDNFVLKELYVWLMLDALQRCGNKKII